MLFLAAPLAWSQGAQNINPHTQIRWPANCRTSGGQTYNWFNNECVDMNDIDPNTQLTWPLSCNVPGAVYDASAGECPANINRIDPGQQIVWPTCAVNQFYAPATNNCITNGTANNPAGSTTQVQFNYLGSFQGDPGLTYNRTTQTLSAGATSSKITDTGGQVYNVYAYGAVSDAVSSVQCNFQPDLSANLRCTDAPFNCAYINSNATAGHPLTITVQGASSAAIQSLVTTISSCTDASNVVLAAPATATPTVYGGILAAGGGNGNAPNSAANSVWQLTGTVLTGATATGNAGQYVTLSGFNNGCTGTTAQVLLSAANTIQAGSIGALNNAVFNGGTGCTAVPTSATCGNGTATCTGTVTFTGGTLKTGNGYYTGAYTTTATGCTPTSPAILSILATRENGGSVLWGTDMRSFIANEGAGYTVGCNVYPTVPSSDGSVYFTVTAVSGTSAIWGTDNYTPFTNWMAACGGTRNCLIPYGKFLINVQTTGINVSAHQIIVPANTKITMDRQGAIYWVGNGHQSGQLFSMAAGTNIEFDGMHFIGESFLNRVPDSGTGGNGKPIIGPNATYNVVVRNSTFENSFGHGGIQTFCNVCSGMTFINNRCHHNNNTCANVSMTGQNISGNILTLDNGFELAGANTIAQNNVIIAGGGFSIGGLTSGPSVICGLVSGNSILNNVNVSIALSVTDACVNAVIANNSFQGFWSIGAETTCSLAACNNATIIGNSFCGRQGSNQAVYIATGFNNKLIGNTTDAKCAQTFGIYSNGGGGTVSTGNMWAGTTDDIQLSTNGQIQTINDTVLTGKWAAVAASSVFVSPSTLILPGNAAGNTPTGGMIFLSGNATQLNTGSGGAGPYLAPKSSSYTSGYNSIFMPQDFPANPATWTPAAVTASTCAEQTVAVPGLVTAHGVTAVPPGLLSTGSHVWIGGTRVSSAGNAAVLFCGDATGGTPVSGAWLFRQ